MSLLVLLGATACCAVVLGGLGRVGAAGGAVARADAVADVVALADVTGGPQAAGQVAAANGAVVVAIDHAGDVSTVVVEVGGTRSTSSAAPQRSGGAQHVTGAPRR